MRRVVVYPGRIAVETADIPAPGPDEALVRTIVTGVCGSDLHAARGRHPFVPLPYRPGHEVVGVIEAAGSAAGAHKPGQRVIVEPDLPCWACKMCTSGRENLCENLQFFGCGYKEGGMADVFSAPAARLHKIPKDFTDYQAALIEPLATPVHAMRLAGDLTGAKVAILGSGTIGLLALTAARRAGAATIVSTDPLASKRELALALGADAVIDAGRDDLAKAVRGELGESADFVFDCVAYEATLAQAIEMAVKGGTVVVLGGARKSASVDLPVIQEFQVRIQGAATYRWEDFDDATAIIGGDAFDANRFITATFPLSSAAAAFAAISSGAEVKILVVADSRTG